MTLTDIATEPYRSREDCLNEFLSLAGKTQFDTKKPEDFDQSVLACIDEEFDEVVEAVEDMLAACEGDYPYGEARENLVKEITDLAYVVSQIAWYFGVPLQQAFDRVHANNMTKVQDGKILRRDDGKILKPDGYVPVDMKGL